MQDRNRFVEATLKRVPYRALRDKRKANEHHGRKDYQQAHGDTVRRRAVNALSALIDTSHHKLRA
jgi:hypothetical protein